MLILAIGVLSVEKVEIHMEQGKLKKNPVVLGVGFELEVAVLT